MHLHHQDCYCTLCRRRRRLTNTSKLVFTFTNCCTKNQSIMLFSKRTFLWTVAILSAPSANMADHGKKNGGKKGCETPDTTCDLDPDVVVITECDTTIPPRGEEGTPTYFVLEADLVCDGTTNGITINGDNVILDCQGFNVVNESPDLLFNGIEIFDATNVLVTNCGVRTESRYC
jgi:hypothetical protein